MRPFESEELTDRELSEMLAAWRVPDPPRDFRDRVFSKRRNTLFNTPDSSFFVGAARQGRSFGAAFLLQAAVIALLLVAVGPAMRLKIKQSSEAISLAMYRVKAPAAQKTGGGGGQHSQTPAAKGAAPKFAAKQFVPPSVVAQAPRLPVVPTISAQAPQIDASVYGDPLSHLAGNGMGNGKGGGVGDGSGNGYRAGSGGNTGGGVFRIGGDVSSPVLLSKVEPEYSEEARKAKFSGTVMLSLVVDENGVPREIHVVRSLGLGLDEKAVEAVAHWRFRPAYRHGVPVSVLANIEVNFRLL